MESHKKNRKNKSLSACLTLVSGCFRLIQIVLLSPLTTGNKETQEWARFDSFHG